MSNAIESFYHSVLQFTFLMKSQNSSLDCRVLVVLFYSFLVLSREKKEQIILLHHGLICLLERIIISIYLLCMPIGTLIVIRLHHCNSGARMILIALLLLFYPIIH